MKVLRKLDYSLITKINTKQSTDLQVRQMYWNLWRQYGYNPEENNSCFNVVDHKWTEAVEKEFYDIPAHKKLLKQMGNFDAGMFHLQADPQTIYKNKQ